MRNEGLLSRGRGVICIDIIPSQKYNTAIFNFDHSLDVDARLDEATKQLVLAHKDKFEILAHSVGRMHTSSATSGSGITFAVAPGLLLTCRHVSVLGIQNTRSISTGIQSFYTTDIKHPVPIREVPIDNTYLNNLAVLDKDPMSEQHGDFVDFDLALFELPGPPWHTLFPTDWSPLFPDTTIPPEGTQVASVHYPGDPDGPVHVIYPHPSDTKVTSVLDRTKLAEVFRVLGQKTLSVGRRLCAEKYPSDNILVYDLAMLGGSSGAPIIRVDAHGNTFCGVHIGGENFADSRWPRGWNHGYSVANPHFVLLYVRYVVPRWGENIPDEVRWYVRAHHDVVNQHRAWLGDSMANWLLSL